MQIQKVSQFDDPGAVSTTYLGRTEMLRKDDIMTQEPFLITDQSTTVGTLLDGTDYTLLLDSGATKGFMSKHCYLRKKILAWAAKV